MSQTFLGAMVAPTAGAALVLGLFGSASVWAQTPSADPAAITAASPNAGAGMAVNELRADAPSSYEVKKGDSLWSIAGIFLKSPWRWPELWDMNMAQIDNPRLIYPGQVLVLDTSDGRARLNVQGEPEDGQTPTVRLTPKVKAQTLPAQALPALDNRMIEPLLSKGIIVDPKTLSQAPRIVATSDGRVFLTLGDRAYARSSTPDSMLTDSPNQKQKNFVIFRNAEALKDPVSGQVLGYEANYLGKAVLVRSEGEQEAAGTAAKSDKTAEVIPATIDITEIKEEIYPGDRLLPEPEPEIHNYVPHAPSQPVDARIVSIYGSAVLNATPNQVVVLDKGSQDGLESGHVLAILHTGKQVPDKTGAAPVNIKLPDERNGLLMVFRTFDRLSYGLVLNLRTDVTVGDRLVNPL